MASRSVVCPEHVGRDDEIAVLHAAVAAIPSGGGRTLLIAGEAGLGKSRLASEAVRVATTAGFRVLTAPCREGAGSGNEPMATALRRFARRLDTDALRALFSGPATLAATMVPEIALAVEGERSVETKREDLHAAVWHLLRRLGETAPTLLLLEDAHWAGTDTLQLARHLVEEAPSLPLWLVITFRPDELHRRHPLTLELARWRRLPAVDEVRLGPLENELLRAMLSALFGGTAVGDEFLHAVADRTGGNPFFVEELCVVLADRGDIFELDGTFQRRSLDEMQMPDTVRETLLARAERLDTDTVELLRLAAIAGETVDPRVLNQFAGSEVIELAVEDALQHQLLVERHDGPHTRYAFRHALVREAILDEIRGPQRQRLHAQVAAALELVHGADADPVAAAVADHHVQAGNLEAAAEWSLRGARHAARQYATDQARFLYETALRLGHRDETNRLSLLLEAAAETFRDSEPAASAAFAAEARDMAARLHDPVAEAEAYALLAREKYVKGDMAGYLSSLRESAGLLEGRGDATEAWALAGVIRCLVTSGERMQVAELMPNAFAIAEANGSDRALALLWNTRGIMAEDDAEIEAAFRRSISHAAAARDDYQRCNALLTAGYVSAWRGNLNRSLEFMRGAVEICDRFFPHRSSYYHAGYAWALSLSGEYDEALRQGLPLERSGDISARMVALAALTEVELRRGEVDRAAAHAEENLRLSLSSTQGQRIDPALSHVARVRLLDSPDGADDIIERFLTRDWNCFTHAFATPDLAAALAARGARGRLVRFVAEVRWRTDRDPHRQNRAALFQCEAVLALVEADIDAARASAAAAIELCRAMPSPAREAECLLLTAEAEWQVGRHRACADAISAALTIADRLRSGPLREGTLALRARTEAEMVLATVLVTDIVSSTERAAALGDRAWRTLLERHHKIVRGELARYRGREIDTAGDGFLAAFDSPARGIRCSRAIVDALADAGVAVRAGLHTGECEVLGDKLAGIVVHVAARVAAAAGAGEVLVTATVRELVAGSNVSLEDRGTVALRGVPGEWQLYAVV